MEYIRKNEEDCPEMRGEKFNYGSIKYKSLFSMSGSEGMGDCYRY
jgi:hypothetical protein